LEPDRYTAVVETVVRKRGRIFPQVTIHLERADPTVCWIGCVSLLEINPDVILGETPTEYRVAAITRMLCISPMLTIFLNLGG